MLKTFDNGFEYLEITNAFAHAKIALQGAHIFEFTQNNTPLLFLSQDAQFLEGKAIRGGVPLCWPWFGKHKHNSELPQHGFARTSRFTLEGIHELDDGSTKVVLTLTPSEVSRKLFDYDFLLRCEITIAKALTISLTTHNCSDAIMPITEALHTYLQVSHINNVTLEGLETIKYVDSLDANFIKTLATPLKIAREVDRIYLNSTQQLKLVDTQSHNIIIEKSGSNNDVIWNPWITKSQAMSDMHNDGYENMLCVEAANALSSELYLQANEKHTITQTLYTEES